MTAENYKQELINAYAEGELTIEDFENTLEHYIELIKNEMPTEWQAEELEFKTKYLFKFVGFVGNFKIRLKKLPNHTEEILRLAKEMNVTVTFQKS